VVIDESLNRILDNTDVSGCKTTNKQDNATSATFIMSANGLQCKVDTLVTDTIKRKLLKTDSIKTESIRKIKK